MPNLLDKTAIITGACAPRGIGRAIALRLAREGAAVVVGDIAGHTDIQGVATNRQDLLAALAEEITQSGGRARAVELDVTRQDQVTEATRAAVDTFGRLDILVNNAGSLAGSDWFMATAPEDWEKSFQVNLLGPMRMAQAAIPEMKKVGGGRIINIGSTGSLGAEPGFGAYTAMKHGLVGLTKTLAAELGPDGILCNTVCPGFIATDMHEAANARLAQQTGQTVNDIKALRYAPVALRDAGTPEDVANAVAFLAGPDGRYVTGINLPVTGGVPYGI